MRKYEIIREINSYTYKPFETKNMANLTLETAKKMYLEGGAGKDFALDNFSEEVLTKKELPKTWWELNMGIPIYFEDKRYVSLFMLEQAMKAYNGDWVADWTDKNFKWCISYKEDIVIVETWRSYNCFLAFKSRDLAEQFLENFRDLIETAKPLL